jgi:hypothetical protein
MSSRSFFPWRQREVLAILAHHLTGALSLCSATRGDIKHSLTYVRSMVFAYALSGRQSGLVTLSKAMLLSMITLWCFPAPRTLLHGISRIRGTGSTSRETVDRNLAVGSLDLFAIRMSDSLRSFSGASLAALSVSGPANGYISSFLSLVLLSLCCCPFHFSIFSPQLAT